MKNNIKIAFFGNSKFSVFCLEEMKNLGQTPDMVITTPDRPMGRKMMLTKSETKVWAEENKVPFIEQEKLKDETFSEKLKIYDLFINEWEKLKNIATSNNLWPFAEGVEIGMSSALSNMNGNYAEWEQFVKNFFQFETIDGRIYDRF